MDVVIPRREIAVSVLEKHPESVAVLVGDIRATKIKKYHYLHICYVWVDDNGNILEDRMLLSV